MTKCFSLLIFLFCLPGLLFAQKDKKEKKDPFTSTEIWVPVPINRQLAHDKIDRIQKKVDEYDHYIDDAICYHQDPVQSDLLDEALFHHVDHLQIVIENLPLDHWKKLHFLQELEKAIRGITEDLQKDSVDAGYYKDLVDNYEVFMKREMNEEGFTDWIQDHFSRSLYGLQFMYEEDSTAMAALYSQMVSHYPDEMFKRFREFIQYPAVTELFSRLAPKNVSLMLTYAMSTSAERGVVRRCKDSLLRMIVRIADQTSSPLKGIVFLEDLLKGQTTIDEVNTVIAMPETYYKGLVQQRMKSHPLTKAILERECKIQALEYVRTMNELHDSPDPVRFKCIENLSPSEMYFLMVLCSDEIYTSTFVGTFNRMLLKMAPQKGDAFLESMQMDKFRTFIRMCAGYNKLDEFLATVDLEKRNDLMARFINHIDRNPETDLEDAVDVADSFGSIHDESLLEYLMGQVKDNYERTYQENNKRGLILYFLLHTLCNSALNPAETSEQLREQLHVPPIHFIPLKNLSDDSGRVVEQVFFYGDEDGLNSFASFQNIFKPDEWKSVKNDKWLTLTSIKGKPMTVYANLPLEEPLDEEAQKALSAYLTANHIHPGIVVHRGHSYHLSGTIEHLEPSNKIIILGSCGGYHNLSTILSHSEDAHIISSKQTGSMHINDPLLASLHKLILAQQDINWMEYWNALGEQMKTPQLQDLFNDYVPPHKNMGALFLKAFKIQMTENGI